MGRRYNPWKVFISPVVFLVMGGCATHVSVFGLRPEYPEVHHLAFVEVDSLQPMLRWESFPRPQDHEADNEGLMNRIRVVTYELKIWRAENDYPGELVYTRQGLPEPSHKIDDSLQRCTKYFWTIRARFTLEGHSRVTEWGLATTSYISPRVAYVPIPFYYRFRTPCSNLIQSGTSEGHGKLEKADMTVSHEVEVRKVKETEKW